MSKIKKSIVGNVLTITFQSGQSIAITTDALTGDIKHQLMMHGLAQKVGDSYAGALTESDARERAQAVIDALNEGQWNAGRTGASGDIVEALSMEMGKTLTECATIIAGMDKERRDALRKHPNIRMHLATITARRMTEQAATTTAPDLMALIG